MGDYGSEGCFGGGIFILFLVLILLFGFGGHPCGPYSEE